jgi:hypothetical protein
LKIAEYSEHSLSGWQRELKSGPFLKNY